MLFKWLSLALVLARINALILRICVPRLFSMIRHMTKHVKAAQKWSNKYYYYTSYLRNRGDFIKVRSVIRIQVFFHRLCAEGAANAAIVFQKAAPIPAEEGAEEDKEQDWDWIYVDPFVRSFICGNIFQYRQLSTLANFTLRLSNTCLLN